MDLSGLLKEGRVKRIAVDLLQAKECLQSAAKDIATARKLLETDPDWAFTIAYNSILRSIRALMFSEGYAPAGENHHKTSLDYASVKLGAKYGPLIGSLDLMRKKRHHAVYDRSGTISKFEAERAILDAENIFGVIKGKARL